jgi:hypothetical protein
MKDLEGNSRDLIEVLSRGLPGGTEAEPQRTSVRVDGVPTKIQTDHLSNKVQSPYLYTSLFGYSHYVINTDYT